MGCDEEIQPLVILSKGDLAARIKGVTRSVPSKDRVLTTVDGHSELIIFDFVYLCGGQYAPLHV